MNEELISAAVHHLERVRTVAMDSAGLALDHMGEEPWLWSLAASSVLFAILWLRAQAGLRSAARQIENLRVACDEQRVLREKEALWRTASANVDAQLAAASRVIDQKDEDAKPPRGIAEPAPPMASTA